MQNKWKQDALNGQQRASCQFLLPIIHRVAEISCYTVNLLRRLVNTVIFCFIFLFSLCPVSCTDSFVIYHNNPLSDPLCLPPPFSLESELAANQS